LRRYGLGAPDGAALRRDNGHEAPNGAVLRRDGPGAPEAAAWSRGGLDGLTATAPTRGAWQGLFAASASVWSMTDQEQREAESHPLGDGSFFADVGKCDVDKLYFDALTCVECKPVT
jgi:hypothetical protein